MTSAALRGADERRLDREAIVAALSAQFVVVPGPARVVRRARLDTFDQRLRAAGLTLEHQSSAAGQRLVLGRPDASTVSAPVTDPRWPALAGDLPASPVRDAVAPVTGIRALTVVNDEKRRVRRVELHNADGKTVARVELDEPASAAAAAAVAPAEVTVQALRGYDDQAARALRLLTASGLRPAVDSEEPVPVERRAPVERAAPATELLAAVLGDFLAAIRENLPGLLDDVDTEFLHDLRVAVRRTRSTLKLGRPVLPEVMRTRWEPEFKWLGDLTTPVRDLDVYELELPEMAGWLVSAGAEDLQPFVTHLRRRRAAERRKLVRGLRSARFDLLQTQWEDALARLAVTGSDAQRDHVSAGELADRGISRAYRLVARGGAGISEASPAQDLHDLRKRGKELRYALEVFAPVVDTESARRAISDLKDLQDVLGRFQDSEVQRHALRGFAEEMMTDGTSAVAVLAMGELIGHLDAEQDRARHDFSGAFARFVRPASHERLLRLGGRR